MMTSPLRLAQLIRGRLALAIRQEQAVLSERLTSAITDLQQMQQWGRQIHRAYERDYAATFEELRRRAGHRLYDLKYRFTEFQHLCEQPLRAIPLLRDVHDELLALEEEFGGYAYDRESHSLSVQTEPIELEDVYLGAFEIQLRLNDLPALSRRPPFCINALDPHPAGSAPHVIHPHVSDHILCTGDAAEPIHNALMAGRLSEFFLIVRQVLNTYNADSPYISLDQWDGEQCADCGCLVAGDDRYYCDNCGRDFCDECMGCCHICFTNLCRGCLATCPSCDESVCGECMESCSHCHENFCKSCLEDGLCPDCLDELENTDDSDTQEEAETSLCTSDAQPSTQEITHETPGSMQTL